MKEEVWKRRDEVKRDEDIWEICKEVFFSDKITDMCKNCYKTMKNRWPECIKSNGNKIKR